MDALGMAACRFEEKALRCDRPIIELQAHRQVLAGRERRKDQVSNAEGGIEKAFRAQNRLRCPEKRPSTHFAKRQIDQKAALAVLVDLLHELNRSGGRRKPGEGGAENGAPPDGIGEHVEADGGLVSSILGLE